MAVTVSVVDANGLVSVHSGVPVSSNPRTNWGTPVSSGSDLNGSVGATSGGSAPAAGAAIDVAFAQSFSASPRSVILSGPLGCYASAITGSGFTVNTLAAGATTTAYAWNFVVLV